MTSPDRVKVVLDTETGGLEPGTHPLIEVAWCPVGSYTIKTLIFPHDATRVDPRAAEVNGYYERGLGDPSRWATEAQIWELYGYLFGKTLVGCNPAFDAQFLTVAAKTFGITPGWHYRLLDLESMAYGLLGVNDVPGLATIVARLIDRGLDIPTPDHTAEGDVRATLACLAALDSIGDRIAI